MKKIISAIILILYCILLFKLLVLKDLPLVRVGSLMLNFGGTHEGPANLIPFKTILPYLMGEKGVLIAGINILGNIILFIPIGFLFPFIFQEFKWKQALLIAAVSGSAIECMQVVLHVGIFDIDDVMLNGFGVMLGYWISQLFNGLLSSPLYKKITAASLAFIFFGVFTVCASLYLTDKLPIRFGSSDNFRISIPQTNFKNNPNTDLDLCGGTGGTGQIIHTENHLITIKRKDGIDEYIKVTEKTTLKSSKGNISEKDLKVGDRVTVVVGLIKEDPLAASLILVCMD